MNEQLTVITVRALLTHFRSTLQTAQQAGEPIIIALRGRTPAGVLLGYEAWEAGQAELAAARQRVAELEAQLARLQPADLPGVGWGLAPQPEPPAMPLDAWASQPWGSSNAQKPPAKAR